MVTFVHSLQLMGFFDMLCCVFGASRALTSSCDGVLRVFAFALGENDQQYWSLVTQSFRRCFRQAVKAPRAGPWLVWGFRG